MLYINLYAYLKGKKLAQISLNFSKSKIIKKIKVRQDNYLS